MGSDANKMNDAATSFKPAEPPALCANGCGFFGAAATMNLCSKCYRLQDDAKAAVDKLVGSPAPEAAAEEVKLKGLNRCLTCNKKVGVMGFKCRCGELFCGSHRYPEKHDCEFDFKRNGREAIAKDNPVVKADKVNRI